MARFQFPSKRDDLLRDYKEIYAALEPAIGMVINPDKILNVPNKDGITIRQTLYEIGTRHKSFPGMIKIRDLLIEYAGQVLKKSVCRKLAGLIRAICYGDDSAVYPCTVLLQAHEPIHAVAQIEDVSIFQDDGTQSTVGVGPRTGYQIIFNVINTPHAGDFLAYRASQAELAYIRKTMGFTTKGECMYTNITDLMDLFVVLQIGRSAYQAKLCPDRVERMCYIKGVDGTKMQSRNKKIIKERNASYAPVPTT